MKPIHSAEPLRRPVPGPGFDAEALTAAAREAVREALARHKANGETLTPEEFAAFLRTEHARWGKVVKFAGAKAE